MKLETIKGTHEVEVKDCTQMERHELVKQHKLGVGGISTAPHFSSLLINADIYTAA